MDFKKLIEENKFVTIKNNTGLELVLSTLGAGVYKVILDGQLLTCSPESETEYLLSPQFFGKTLGQVAGRLIKEIDVDGEKLVFDDGNTENNFILHSGVLDSLSFKNYNYEILEDEEDSISVKFEIDAETKYFKGEAINLVIYTLDKNKNDFMITFLYKNRTNKTVANFSNHIYWNFNQDDILNYKLTVNADSIATTDDKLLINGFKDISYPYDFNDGDILKNRIRDIENIFPTTIDHAFIKTDENDPLIISLENDKYILKCMTGYSCANIYLCNVNDKTKLIGIPESYKYVGLAIEPQHFILSDDIKLDKDETYANFINYSIIKK